MTKIRPSLILAFASGPLIGGNALAQEPSRITTVQPDITGHQRYPGYLGEEGVNSNTGYLIPCVACHAEALAQSGRGFEAGPASGGTSSSMPRI